MVMATVKMRSTRKLRNWIVEQVSSGKYPGLVWDDEAKTMFRIPWKHAGKQDFRQDEDAAIFKAWAEFKGKLKGDEHDNPASWKTRLRCALSKSKEFAEVLDRAQLDISEPYKVYRLVPECEQGLEPAENKCVEKTPRRSKRRSSVQQSEDTAAAAPAKKIKTEEVSSQCPEEPSNECPQATETLQLVTIHRDGVDEISVNVRIEENVSPPPEDQDSFNVSIQYLGQEVLRRHIQGNDVRIMYLPTSVTAPALAPMRGRFPRIPLPEPPASLPAGEQLAALRTLLPFMERGVLLTSTAQGLYGKRFCQGRVFWSGPHGSQPGPHKMERNTEPVLLFSKDTFRQQLENFRTNGGEPPQCSFTLCFGEELSNTEDVSAKLIIAQITLPWAEQQVKNARSFFESISFLQTLASQSPLGEITLNLVAVPDADDANDADS